MKELKFKSYSKVKEISTSGDIGNRIIKIAGWATRITDPLTGEINVDRDGEIVDFSGFDLEAKVLLAYHDMNRPVGKVKLTKKPDGIWFDAEVFEAMDKQVFVAVEQGIIDSVSIGFQAYDYEFKQVNGEDVLTWTSGSIYETSLVTIPSNKLAVFDTVKSLIKDHKCTGLSCSIKALKEMNPDCGCQMEKQADKTDFPKKGDNEKISLRNSNFKQFDHDFAQNIKDNYPDIWKKGGNIRGNEAYEYWTKARDGDTTEGVSDWIKEREAWAARHYGNTRIAGVVALMKWGVIGEIGMSEMKKIINEEKK
jgi:HK97 family phage prohead protease